MLILRCLLDIKIGTSRRHLDLQFRVQERAQNWRSKFGDLHCLGLWKVKNTKRVNIGRKEKRFKNWSLEHSSIYKLRKTCIIQRAGKKLPKLQEEIQRYRISREPSVKKAFQWEDRSIKYRLRITGVEIIRSSVILNCFGGIEGIRLIWVQERMRSGIGDKYRQLLFLKYLLRSCRHCDTSSLKSTLTCNFQIQRQSSI